MENKFVSFWERTRDGKRQLHTTRDTSEQFSIVVNPTVNAFANFKFKSITQELK